MKRIGIIFVCALLFLTGCIPNLNDDEEVLPNDEEMEGQRSIVPSYRLSDENYRMIIPYRTSKARGAITNQIGNRLDIDEVEEGLRRHSKDFFAPDDYYFEEGQYLDTSTVFRWIDELNPTVERGSEAEEFRENPRYLSHILEQNFLVRTEDKSVKLEGVSIGLALKSVYRFRTDIGEPPLSEEIPFDTMLEKGKEIAQVILERLREREELQDIPIMFALYREEAHGSAIPGNFVSRTFVEGGDRMIGSWESINEEYILFPSREASSKYLEDAQVIQSFGTDIAEFFPNYVGVIGKGFYIDEELQRLTLEVPIEFYGKGEVLGFTQYAYGLIKEKFTKDYFDVEVNITSNQGQEALIVRKAGEQDPLVHIFH